MVVVAVGADNGEILQCLESLTLDVQVLLLIERCNSIFQKESQLKESTKYVAKQVNTAL